MDSYQISFQGRTLCVADERMQETIQRATLAAQSFAPVLLVGESGTGKELIARYIHERSPRAKNRFVSVNCAAIPDGLMEAELYGFEKGAFTGALNQRIGKFEQASGGTLLLDEVSEMSLALQAKLLRALQENEIDRIGSKATIAVNTRIIATTNRDPIQLVQSGKFREDLYYRLNVIRIECHPLRGRADAILTLAQNFLQSYSAEYSCKTLRLADRAKQKLVDHSWPGNIRELRNALERASLLCPGGEIQAQHLEGLSSLAPMPTGFSFSHDGRTLADVERQHIESVLEYCQGNRTEAARRLGISIRTLRNKLNEYRKNLPSG